MRWWRGHGRRWRGAEPRGLKRRGEPRAEINALRQLYMGLSEGNFREAARKLSEEGAEGELSKEVLEFILGPSDRSFLTPK